MTVNGTMDINDVQQSFDQLQYYEKRKFILNNFDQIGDQEISDLVSTFNIDTYDICQFLSTEDVCNFFNYNELLREIGRDEIIRYLLEWEHLSNSDIEDILTDNINHNSIDSNQSLERILKSILYDLDQKNHKE
jgi:hypothetical protein